MTKQTIQAKKNYEILMERLMDMIKNNDLKPGDKLDSIEKLSKDFGVSRSVVREALSGLKVLGIVSIQQGEGTFITNNNSSLLAFPSFSAALLMKKEDIKELLEVRKILEIGAVRLAAQNRSNEDLHEIKSTLTKMEKNSTIDELSDYAFHFHVITASKNKMLIHLLQSISDLMIETIRDTQKIILRQEPDASQLIIEHKKIYQAIKTKQPALAEKYMLEHLHHVEKSLAPYIYEEVD